MRHCTISYGQVWSAKRGLVDDDEWGPFCDLADRLPACLAGGIRDGVEEVMGDHLD
jgi:hypothetical protein